MSQLAHATSGIMQFVNRCTEAFHRAIAEHKDHQAAGNAFLAELPILSDPTAFQAYFACLGQALTLGVIDLVDLGRYCHLARMAMSAWKLANPVLTASMKTATPTPPKGNHFAQEEALQPISHPAAAPGNSLTHPPKGNLSGQEANRRAASHLPDIDTQHALYKSLRQRGVQIPSNSHLRKNPVTALYFCSLAKSYLNEQPTASNQTGQAAA